VIGRIVQHSHLGTAKIIEWSTNRARVRYVDSGQEFVLGPTAISEGILARKLLSAADAVHCSGRAMRHHARLLYVGQRRRL
jgi:hypothetical protein